MKRRTLDIKYLNEHNTTLISIFIDGETGRVSQPTIWCCKYIYSIKMDEWFFNTSNKSIYYFYTIGNGTDNPGSSLHSLFFFLPSFWVGVFFFWFILLLSSRSVRGKRDVFNVWSFFFWCVVRKWRYQGENIRFFFVECKIRWIEYNFFYWSWKGGNSRSQTMFSSIFFRSFYFE